MEGASFLMGELSLLGLVDGPRFISKIDADYCFFASSGFNLLALALAGFFTELFSSLL